MLPRPPRPPQSLTVRLLVLVVSVVLLVEALIFVPGVQRERGRWLRERLDDAQLVALALDTNGSGIPSDAVRRALVRLSDAEMIRILTPTGPHTVLAPAPAPARTDMPTLIDLSRETWLEGYFRALGGLIEPSHHRRLELIGSTRIGRLDLLVAQEQLARFLRVYALQFAAVAALIAAATGLLLFVALRAMLVIPLRRMARNIAAFRADPERGIPLDAERVSIVHDDEITMVGRELSAMQAELRTALWRNARLAAVGTAMSKMSHDLRGILSSALLVADRLTTSTDPAVQRAGEVTVRAVHRATRLAQYTLDFVREGPPPLTRAPAHLRALTDDAAAAADPARQLHLQNDIAADAIASVDRESLLRVLTNLFRNAAQAGAHTITASATGEGAGTILTIDDDGTGIPQTVQKMLFRPFVSSATPGGSGLGLAIARDLMRAHGGDLELTRTASSGTCFSLYLQQPKRPEE